MATKWLRQIGSGHIYHWTEALARRKDMVPYDDETAAIRIEALRKRVEEMKARRDRAAAGAAGPNPMQSVIDQANELTRLEAEADRLTEEEITAAKAEALREAKGEITPVDRVEQEKDPETLRKERIDADDQVRAVRAMTDKEQVADYMAAEFGKKIDLRKSLDALKEQAEGARVERMFEGEDI